MLAFLWITVIVDWIDYWITLSAAFVLHNTSPNTIVNVFVNSTVIETVAASLSYLISDGILVKLLCICRHSTDAPRLIDMALLRSLAEEIYFNFSPCATYNKYGYVYWM